MTQDLVFEAPRRGLPPRHFADLDTDGRVQAVAALGFPAFRAKQLAAQYYGRLTGDPREMTDLPAGDRDAVAEALFPPLLTVVREVECDAGETRKTLWRGHDGATFESVVMRYPDRATVCISSQAGCGMACPFCATGQGGLTRNLSTAEILEQVRAAARSLRDRDGERLSNIVFMGMGEPLANYARVVAAVRRITAAPPDGFGISARSVTVSTVGLAPAIRALADEHLGVTLALSLHTP
ncbi:MAG TPA: 23S rRNA (adenine(2503)-C(2))-methyltransferase RlmN, partial [Mycobacterium sp.]|nr:23S rRNA (adenine(2503)-C(2))-methyltransferase RlmN [Mycobacterium sp.]